MNEKYITEFHDVKIDVEDCQVLKEFEEIGLIKIPVVKRLTSDLPIAVVIRDLHVVALKITQEGLGFIPDFIDQLQSLEELILDDASLKSLPEGMERLKALKSIELDGNLFTSFPIVLLSLHSLQGISLADNEITEIPPELTSFSALQYLNLRGNEITTIPKAIGHLPHLEVLLLANNPIETFPLELQQLKSLRVLSISTEDFESIPIGLETWMKALKIQGCEINPEQIPSFDVGNNVSVTSNQHRNTRGIYEEAQENDNIFPKEQEYLNQLEKIIGMKIPMIDPEESFPPFGYVIHSRHIVGLFLSGLELESIPDWIGELTTLEFLNLAANQITTLPTSMNALQHLNELHLNDNHFTQVPAVIKELTKLEVLNLSENQISELPEDMGEMRCNSTLVELYLQGNQIKKLPQQIRKLCTLTILNVALNPITQFPIELLELSNLETLDLSFTPLTRGSDLKKEAWFLELKAKCELINDCAMEFEGIPMFKAEIFALKMLRKLYPHTESRKEISGMNYELYWSEAIGAIKIGIQNYRVTQLSFKDLKIQSLPRELWTLVGLKSLIVEHCPLEFVDESIGSLIHLRELILINTELHSIPDEITNLHSLRTLIIQESFLRNLPIELSDLPHLEVLDLAKNMIESIPNSIGVLEKLKIIDFSSNALIGIPKSMLKLTHIEKLGLPMKAYTSESPKWMEDWLDTLEKAGCQINLKDEAN